MIAPTLILSEGLSRFGGASKVSVDSRGDLVGLALAAGGASTEVCKYYIKIGGMMRLEDSNPTFAFSSEK